MPFKDKDIFEKPKKPKAVKKAESDITKKPEAPAEKPAAKPAPAKDK